jgi:DNA repair exonuclease SbcCD ATPase subunit
MEILDFWKDAFGDTGIKAILLDESIPILNKKAIELNEMITNLRVRFDSQKSLKSGDLRDKFSINVVQTQNLSEYNELSAGVTRIVNIIVLLCLRHLLETMSNKSINIMLFDELFDSLDDENSGIIIDMVKRFKNPDRCILMISHRHKDTINADEVYAL